MLKKIKLLFFFCLGSLQSHANNATFDALDSYNQVLLNIPFVEIDTTASALQIYSLSTYEITNRQFACALQFGLINGIIPDQGGVFNGEKLYDSLPIWGPEYSPLENYGLNEIDFNTSTLSFFVPESIADFPVRHVSWHAAYFVAYILNKIHDYEEKNQLEKWSFDENKTGFSIPTFNQWKWAGSGGNENAKYPTGTTINNDSANYGMSVGNPVKVGSFDSNFFGLYDMAGNVWEWLLDDDPIIQDRALGAGGNWLDGSESIENDSTFSYDKTRYSHRGGIRIAYNKNSSEVLSVIPSGSISANGMRSFFVKDDGSLWGIGENIDGALGIGTSGLSSDMRDEYSEFDLSVDKATPVKILSSGVKTIVAGKYHTCFTKTDGSLWGMGYNGTGQLGNGKTEIDYRDKDYDGIREASEIDPILVSPENVINYALSETSTWFVTNEGTLWSIGGRQYDQYSSSSPVKRIDSLKIVQVGITEEFEQVYFLNSNGELRELFFGTPEGLNYSVHSDTIYSKFVDNEVSYFSAGSDHLLILKSDGSLWAMGSNESGQFGNGQDRRTNSNLWIGSYQPELIVESDVKSISAGNKFSLFTKTNGSLWGMGLNWDGQLGINKNESKYQEIDENGYPYAMENSPVEIMPNSIEYAEAGDFHSLFVQSDTSLWGVGFNMSGQLGLGTHGGGYEMFDTGIDHDTPISILESGVSSEDGNSSSNENDINLDTDGDGLTDLEEISIGTSPYSADTDEDGLPDKIETDAGMNPLQDDSLIILTTKKYFTENQNTTEDALHSTPYTLNWYYQPNFGWMWTNNDAFPYIFKSSSSGELGNWLYFSEKSHNPIRMFDYKLKNWISLTE